MPHFAPRTHAGSARRPPTPWPDPFGLSPLPTGRSPPPKGMVGQRTHCTQPDAGGCPRSRAGSIRPPRAPPRSPGLLDQARHARTTRHAWPPTVDYPVPLLLVPPCRLSPRPAGPEQRGAIPTVTSPAERSRSAHQPIRILQLARVRTPDRIRTRATALRGRIQVVSRCRLAWSAVDRSSSAVGWRRPLPGVSLTSR